MIFFITESKSMEFTILILLFSIIDHHYIYQEKILTSFLIQT